MAKTAARSAEVDSLDRLEDKIKRLVAMVERMKSEQAHAAEDNQRLKAEIEALKSRAATGDSLSTEIAALVKEHGAVQR